MLPLCGYRDDERAGRPCTVYQVRPFLLAQAKEDINVKPYALAAVLLTACAIGLLLYHQPARVIGAPAPEAAKQKWEYKEITFSEVRLLGDPEGKKENPHALGLNKLGAEGWELVAVVPNNNDRRADRYVFKRAK